MDAAQQETIQLVSSRVEADAQEHSPTQAVSLTKVLDDDNLLREIIVRVASPTTLIRAAVVCRRWLEHASDRKFLSRFRELNPPRLLGYYITKGTFSPEEMDETIFFPMLPQPPELAVVMRRLESYNLGASTMITHCQDGSVFAGHREGTRWIYEVHRPMCRERRRHILPPLPEGQGHNQMQFGAIFSKEEGNSKSYMYVWGEDNRTSTAHVYILQDGEWLMLTSVTCPRGMRLCPVGVYIGHDKIYLPSAISDDIIVLDLVASSYSAIQPPQGVKYCYLKSMLSRADDASSVYLIHVKGFQLHIWLHKEDNWLLVDTISLHELLCTLGMLGNTLGNDGITNVLIREVGDNGQFVILQMGECIFFLDIKCRTLSKVYVNTVKDRYFGSIHAFMMIWPPTFPALKDDSARFAFHCLEDLYNALVKLTN